jgi:hypothetical protein
LKPWRDLDNLKDYDESWEEIFNLFISNTSQQDRDVVAGSQYYYEIRTSWQTELMKMSQETWKKITTKTKKKGEMKLNLKTKTTYHS